MTHGSCTELVEVLQLQSLVWCDRSTVLLAHLHSCSLKALRSARLPVLWKALRSGHLVMLMPWRLSAVLKLQCCSLINCGRNLVPPSRVACVRRVHRQLVQSDCPDALLEGYLSATPARVQAARTHFSNRKRQLPAFGCLDSLLLACDVIFISDEYR